MITIIHTIFGIIFGVILGFLSGIVISLHPNNIAPILYWNLADKIILTSTIVSMSVSYSIFSFLATILFRYGDIDTFLAIDMYRRLINEIGTKRFYILTVYGGLVAAILSILIYTILGPVVHYIYFETIKYLPIFIGLITLFMIYKSKNRKAFLLLFFFSGVLGYFSLKTSLTSYAKLSAMLTGLFGIPYLVLSILNNKKNYKRAERSNNDKEFYVGFIDILKSSIIGVVSSLIILVFPSLTPVHGFLLITSIVNLSIIQSVIAVGSLNTADQILSLMFVEDLGNPRSGSAFFYELLGNNSTLLLISIILISVSLSALTSIYISELLNKYNLKFTSNPKYITVILFVITLMIYYLGGIVGVLILITSSSLGIWSTKYDVERLSLTGSIILPTIMLFLT